MNLRNPKEYCESLLVIRNKKQELVPLRFNEAQSNLYAVIRQQAALGKPIRIIILKGRQEGISTVTEALMFQDTVTRPNVKTLIVAHDSGATGNLFKMNKLFYDCLPRRMQPMRKNSNAKELVFENPTREPKEKAKKPGLRSSIRCQTAGSGSVGRSDTLTNVHISEYAFWPKDKKDLLLGIMQTVPNDPSTMVVIESTANGYDHFKELWDGAENGTNEWIPVFLPWYLEKGYRMAVPPGTEWTEEERQLQRDFGLDEEQLQWRRWCIRANCGGSVEEFRQEYPNTPAEAVLLSGTPFFDNQALAVQQMHAPEPAVTGWFTYDAPEEQGEKPRNWQFTPAADGAVRIWKEPEKGVPYVLGGDTAGEGSDCFTAHVLDNRTGEQVAELQQRQSEILYARQVYCLGRYYNTALAAIEVNFGTYPVRKLEEWNYPKLYQRERFDTYANAMVKAFGWQTSPATRPQMLAELHTVMEESPHVIRSRWTLGEMIVFVYDKNRKPQAAEGQHDDLVIAAAIAQMARSQQQYTVEEPGRDKSHWTPDMWEDYNRADAETRKYLEKKWART